MQAHRTDTLIATDVLVKEQGDTARLSCRLHAAGVTLPESLWVDVPVCHADALAATADPFLPALLLRAMKERRRLVIEGDVSAALLASTRRIKELLIEWTVGDKTPLADIDVSASPVVAERRGATTAAFFSGGVDSFYTLLRNHARYPATDSRRIRDLLLVLGFDIRLGDTELFGAVRASAEMVADQLGTRLVVVRTNVREVLRPLDWARVAVGAGLAAVGLALPGLFHTVLIPSGRPFHQLRPSGSHPSLDPLWSTEGLEFVWDGGVARRADKIEYLVSSPLALAHLRVCWENRDRAYNCGRCEKCLRTMVELEVHGVLHRAARFPVRIDLEAIDALQLSPNVYWAASLARLRSAGRDPALTAAVERAVDRGAWRASPLGRVDARVSAALGRAGLTARRLKHIDRTLLGGAGLRLFRRVARRGVQDRADSAAAGRR